VGNQWRSDGSGWDWNPKKQYIVSAVEESLKRLKTDYIDLYQLHGGTIEDDIDEVIDAFKLLKQQGKIKHYGISSIRPNVIRQYVDRSHISSVMMQYSLLDRRPEETCLQLLQQNSIGVLARGSVAQGLLVNKPAKPYLKYNAEEVKAAADAIKKVSGSKRNEAQAALQFVLQNPAITAAVVGIRTMEQLEDAVATIDVPLLDEDELKILRASVPPNFYEEHR
jgi:aryl-alcohol dehydrogenase-like predicted oxidoreductase